MKSRALAAGLIFLTVMPAAAHADGLIIPSFGVNFGGEAGESLSSAFDAKKSTWGISVAWMGAGVIGLEGDFGYAPDFYGKTDTGGTSAFTFTGNLLVGIPFGGQQGFGIRPFGLIGVGLVRSDVEALEDLVGSDDSDGVWDVGGGVMVFFASHVGVRADVRYFRTFSAVDLLGVDSNHLDFTRGSLGFILRF